MKKSKELEDILKSVVVGTSFGSVFPLMGYFGRHSNNMDVKGKLLETKDRVYRMVDSDDDLGNKILKLYDLKNSING